jgi:ring-1,2-phenylacetyl-CoA epoxidase subunit PaaC
VITTSSIAVADMPLLRFVLRRADDALILGHRLAEWCGHAPTLEEDLALANIGLDLIGQARGLYAYAGEIEGAGRGEDDYAYLRDERAYGNLLLLERPNGDFAHTILRQFLYAAFIDPWWRAMTRSADARLAAVAGKAEKETAYHLRHAADWTLRLGDGTAESHNRAQAALDALWPYTAEMFESDAIERNLIETGIAPDPAELRAVWIGKVEDTLNRATLVVPTSVFMHSGGRAGRHSEYLGYLLAELQYLQRVHPGAKW